MATTGLPTHSCYAAKTRAHMRGCGGVIPPKISTPGPSCTLMGISRSRSGPVSMCLLYPKLKAALLVLKFITVRPP